MSEEDKDFPLIVSSLPEVEIKSVKDHKTQANCRQGVNVTTSGVEVAGRDIVCLFLIFLLLIYSCINCYNQWKKNYQLIDGDFAVFRGVHKVYQSTKILNTKFKRSHQLTKRPPNLSPQFKPPLSVHSLQREPKWIQIRRQGPHPS